MLIVEIWESLLLKEGVELCVSFLLYLRETHHCKNKSLHEDVGCSRAPCSGLSIVQRRGQSSGLTDKDDSGRVLHNILIRTVMRFKKACRCERGQESRSTLITLQET